MDGSQGGMCVLRALQDIVESNLYTIFVLYDNFFSS